MNTQGWIRGYMAKNMEEEKFLVHVVECLGREFEAEAGISRKGDEYSIELGQYEIQLNAADLHNLKLKGAYCLDAYLLDQLQLQGFEFDKYRSQYIGRVEERTYYYSADIEWISTRKDWEKLTGIGMVVRKVEENGIKREERGFHLGSVNTVDEYAEAVRKHWGIESMHWSLDVTFREDASRTRKGKAPENLAMLKRLVMNMVRKDDKILPKKSLRIRRVNALLDEAYLEYILNINFG